MLKLLVIGSLTFVPFKNVGLTAGTAPECDGGATRMISLCFEFRFRPMPILYRSPPATLIGHLTFVPFDIQGALCMAFLCMAFR
jgi:hypothetical protein